MADAKHTDTKHTEPAGSASGRELVVATPDRLVTFELPARIGPIDWDKSFTCVTIATSRGPVVMELPGHPNKIDWKAALEMAETLPVYVPPTVDATDRQPAGGRTCEQVRLDAVEEVRAAMLARKLERSKQ